jgi:hypothetical protein
MTAKSELTVRVWVEGVWDTVSLTVAPDWQLGRVKAEAIEVALGSSDPADYQVKFHGALVLDEKVSLAEMKVADSATLTLLSARRRPVR